MKRLAIAIIAVLMTAGCEPTKQEQAKSDYVFEELAREDHGGLAIVKVTNMATGRSVRVMRNSGHGLILLPSEF